MGEHGQAPPNGSDLAGPLAGVLVIEVLPKSDREDHHLATDRLKFGFLERV